MSGRAPKVEAPILKVGPGRLSFPFLFAPKPGDGGVDKYTTSLLLPPDYDVAFILEALEATCVAAWGPRPKWSSTARKPEQVVRRCEEKPNFAGYEPGWHFVSCSSNDAPNIVSWDPNVPITDAKECYAGRWAKVSMRPFCYNNVGVGVSLGLNNVQLLRNDTIFGRTRGNQDFDLEAAEVGAEF